MVMRLKENEVFQLISLKLTPNRFRVGGGKLMNITGWLPMSMSNCRHRDTSCTSSGLTN